MSEKDKLFGLVEKCPKCGSRRVYYIIQYPLIVKQALNGKPFIHDDNGKRVFLSSTRLRSWKFDSTITSEYQMAQLVCEKCESVIDVNDID